MHRRLGGVSPPLEGPPEPGNRFVSFVRACARFVCHVKMGNKSPSPTFPFPFWPREAFPFPFWIEVKSKCDRSEIEVTSK